MEEKYIQTLHPTAGKKNKKILSEKYHVIREHLLDILATQTPTHTEMMELLYARLKDSFEGGIQWYGETVKLDLEARGIVERTQTKPEKYRITTIK
ncbi:MAG: hypothetical protein WBO36_03810 [Saprospiraceae bacterium]